MFFTIIIFLITLLILVLSHEFGHFFAAKKFGVKVLEFGFGLPPKIWGKKIGETIFSLNLLPIGGFVRLFGEDETDKKILENKRSFGSKPVWQRIAIVTAGVIMNFILAAILFWIVLFAQGFTEKIPLLVPYRFIGVEQTDQTLVLIGQVSPNSPADQVGIKPGDQVVGFNAQKITSGEQLITLTKENTGKSSTLTLQNDQNNLRTVTVTPRANPPAGQGALGVELGTVSVANLSYQGGQRVFSGITHSYNLASYSIAVLSHIISTAFETKDLAPVSQSVSGPVGVTNLASMILNTKSPLIPYLNFMALLSLNLAIINILPFPALDGGRLFFLSIEAIFRKKVKAEIERLVHTVGMAILIALILLVTFSDIKKFF